MRRVSWEDHTAHRGAVELESTGNKQRECIMFTKFRFPSRIRLIDGGGDEGGSGDGGDGGEPKSFTQEQVDQIVEKRLAKERGRYKDYDELKAKDVPAELLRGSTKEELEAHADLLHAALHPASKPSQVKNQIGTPSHQNDGKDADGDSPTVTQLAASSMDPHLTMLKSWAAMFASAMNIPASSLGIVSDANPTSADATEAQREDLIIEARHCDRDFGESILQAARLVARLQDSSVSDEDLMKLQVD